MLATLIPFFDKDMKVCAYSLFSQKANLLLNPALQGSCVWNFRIITTSCFFIIILLFTIKKKPDYDPVCE